MSKSVDHTGKRFGRLVVEGRADDKGSRNRRWVCRCDCGATHSVRGTHLVTGAISSCGCLSRDVTAARNRLHGHARRGKYSAMWMVWCAMKERCSLPTSKSWPRYGGRGIKVCDRWRDSFADFLLDMGERPTASHQLDRINNDGDYEPGNCRWATRPEQARNKRNTRFWTIGDETMTLPDWCRRAGLDRCMVLARLRAGADLPHALSAPAGKYHGKRSVDTCTVRP
jgi:pentatricopeptide repeat protein